MLRLLQGMPGLQVVNLSTVTLSGAPLPGNLPLVKLSETWKFEYSGTQGNLDFQLLSQLKFEQWSALHLEFTTEFLAIESHGVSPTFTAAMTAIQAVSKGAPQIRELHVYSDDDSLTLQMDQATFIIISSVPMALNNQYFTWMSANATLFTEVQHLNVISETLMPEFWPIVAKLSKLRLIEIDSDQGGELFNLFITNRESRQPSKATAVVTGTERQPQLIFPMLQRVHLQLANFDRISKTAIDALQHRRNHGKEIHVLELEYCSGLGDFWIPALSKVVGKLDWDEIDGDV